MHVFGSIADEELLIDYPSFEQCMAEYFVLPNNPNMTAAEQQRAKIVLERLFNSFDQDHNGFVDHAELVSGMSILCGGSREEKVKAAFDLYDVNGDGFISFEEMISYLASVYKLMFEVSPQTQDSVGVSADHLAQGVIQFCPFHPRKPCPRSSVPRPAAPMET